MSILVNSLSRLYPEKVDINKLKAMVKNNNITSEDFKTITGEDYE